MTSTSIDIPKAMSAVTTLCDAFEITVRANPDKIALRSADGSTVLSWAEYAERSRRIASGLAQLGVGHGDTVALMTTNRPEFHLCDTAVFHLGAVPFSLYATSSPEQIAYVLSNADCKVLIVEDQFLPVVRSALSGSTVEHLICLDNAATGTISLADVEASADDDFDLFVSGRSVQADDVLTLIYTSGTTGAPKGVQTTHANMVAQIQGAAAVLPITPGGRAISYLPLAHIADRWAHHYNAMYFALEVTCLPDLKQFPLVLPAVRPQFVGCVPRVLEKIKIAVEMKVAADSEAVRNGFAKAMGISREVLALRDAGLAVPDELQAMHAQLDAQVLSRVREMLGLNDATALMVGAAPTPPAVYEFFRALGLPISEVYGMSEASCVMTAANPAEARQRTVGKALPNIELKLAEDNELLCRGPIVMKGYRKDPERTAEAVDADGWLHTGDIAHIDQDGYVRIVDRKKEIIINAGGKNMSPANIEGTIKPVSPLIGQVVVIGDARPYNTALVVLDPDVLPVWAGRHGIDGGSFATHPEILAEIGTAIETANGRLARVEQIKKFTILDAEWLPGGDELTPTMKLKRRPISDKYADEIRSMYAE